MCALDPWVLSDVPWCKWGQDFVAKNFDVRPSMNIWDVGLGIMDQVFHYSHDPWQVPIPTLQHRNLRATQPLTWSSWCWGVSRNQQKSDKAVGLTTPQRRDPGIGVGGPTPSASLFHMLGKAFKKLSQRAGKEGRAWRSLDFMAKSPPDTFGMSSLVYVLGSAFLYIWAGNT